MLKALISSSLFLGENREYKRLLCTCMSIITYSDAHCDIVHRTVNVNDRFDNPFDDSKIKPLNQRVTRVRCIPRRELPGGKHMLPGQNVLQRNQFIPHRSYAVATAVARRRFRLGPFSRRIDVDFVRKYPSNHTLAEVSATTCPSRCDLLFLDTSLDTRLCSVTSTRHTGARFGRYVPIRTVDFCSTYGPFNFYVSPRRCRSFFLSFAIYTYT